MLTFAAFSSNKKSGTPKTKAVYHADSSKVALKHFNAAAIDRYRHDPAFNYTVNKQRLTWWDNFWDWVWDVWQSFKNWLADIIQKLFGGVRIGRSAFPVFRLVLLLLAIVLVVYVISRLMGIDLLRYFKKNQAVDDIPFSESLENIHQIDFDEAIENALAVKDYRLAVRLLYLRCLKQLSDARLIDWRLEKTNTAYLNELTDQDQRRLFSVLTRQFEYVWYGEFPLDGDSFGNINNVFVDFKNRLS
jgi:hypothetical protein